MDKMMVFMMLLGIGVACNTSKHHGTGNKKNEIDSLPPTIINPPAKSRPSISADTTSYHRMKEEAFPDLSILKASESCVK
jgi:hypothetical protein